MSQSVLHDLLTGSCCCLSTVLPYWISPVYCHAKTKDVSIHGPEDPYALEILNLHIYLARALLNPRRTWLQTHLAYCMILLSYNSQTASLKDSNAHSMCALSSGEPFISTHSRRMSTFVYDLTTWTKVAQRNSLLAGPNIFHGTSLSG